MLPLASVGYAQREIVMACVLPKGVNVLGNHMRAKAHLHPSDLRGASRLAVDAVIGLTDLVEAMHHNITSLARPLGKSPAGSTRGITGLAYRTVRGVTRLVGGGVDIALAPLAALLEERESSSARDAVGAALNGVLGDYLVETGNPLAVSMHLCSRGKPLVMEKAALAAAFPKVTGKVLVLVHGLCMSEQQWLRQGHDHGAALARDLGYTPVYLRYNSGLHISANGREFTAMLELLTASWPVEIEELVILAHSMGGLVARSALYYGEVAGHNWPKRLRSLVFLGTPHHGAPLERGGHWVDTILGVSPYTAPFVRLGKIRSAGITDLRFGDLRDEDWLGHEQHKRAKATKHALPLPEATNCYAVAATTGEKPGDLNDRLLGDGLVPLSSALGQHPNPALDLAIPANRQWVGYAMNHMDLLSSPDVYAQIRQWLAP